jgi:sulfur-carrier protein
MRDSKQVEIQYFAALREQRGTHSETLTTSAQTLADLYSELRDRYKFSLPVELVQVAVDDEFCNWQDRVQDKSRVVFIPPVAGG